MSGWLIDKSALVRLGRSTDRSLWAERIERGLVRVCTVTRLEVGHSARSGTDLRLLEAIPPMSALLIEHLTPAIEERAVEVQRLLADRGQQRSASLADILVAATAEIGRLTVLHVDKDFELIGELTGQPLERLAMPGAGAGAADGKVQA